jgi:putative Ca2+/H+ antiporter (TMEM165/GDT1 family)
MVDPCHSARRPVAQVGHSRSSSAASAGTAAASRASTWAVVTGRSAGSWVSRAVTARSTADGTSGLRLLAGGGGRPAGASAWRGLRYSGPVDLAVVLTTFVVIFPAELPDKSLFAGGSVLVLLGKEEGEAARV